MLNEESEVKTWNDDLLHKVLPSQSFRLQPVSSHAIMVFAKVSSAMQLVAGRSGSWVFEHNSSDFPSSLEKVGWWFAEVVWMSLQPLALWLQVQSTSESRHAESSSLFKVFGISNSTQNMFGQPYQPLIDSESRNHGPNSKTFFLAQFWRKAMIVVYFLSNIAVIFAELWLDENRFDKSLLWNIKQYPHFHTN